MKSILITASAVGVVIAGLIFYFSKHTISKGKSDHSDSTDTSGRLDEQERNMKYAMG